MKVSLVVLGVLLALSGPAAAEESGPRRSPLIFSGNVVLNDEVYLAVLDLPPVGLPPCALTSLSDSDGGLAEDRRT